MLAKLAGFRVLMLSGLVTIAGASSAAAGPISFVDTFTPADVFFKSGGGECTGLNGATDTVVDPDAANRGCGSLAFSLFLPGYTSATDTLYSALVSLAFHDDGGDGTETLSIQLDTITKSVTISGSSTNNSPFFYSFWNPLEQLAVDGRVDLKLTQSAGDFWFDGAGVVAVGSRSEAVPVPVPEPTSLFLLGTGAVGLLASRRRRPSPRP